MTTKMIGIDNRETYEFTQALPRETALIRLAELAGLDVPNMDPELVTRIVGTVSSASLLMTAYQLADDSFRYASLAAIHGTGAFTPAEKTHNPFTHIYEALMGAEHADERLIIYLKTIDEILTEFKKPPAK